VYKIDAADPAYLARAILELACSYDHEGNLPEALRYYVEATEAAIGTDRLAGVHAAASTAVLRSDEGDHAGALRDLHRLSCVIRSISHAYPHVYYEYANNLAVVLTRTGRIKEARQAIQVALASPLAPRYPEWHDTAREIEEAARTEPHRVTPTIKIAAATLAARPKQALHRLTKRPRRVLFIARVRFDLTGTEVPLRFSSRNIVSLLDRYVKTVRIRDRP
jgi:tetratricopeptide (TPR) repeat protein